MVLSFFHRTKLGERGILHGSASTFHQDGPWLGKQSITTWSTSRIKECDLLCLRDLKPWGFIFNINQGKALNVLYSWLSWQIPCLACMKTESYFILDPPVSGVGPFWLLRQLQMLQSSVFYSVLVTRIWLCRKTTPWNHSVFRKHFEIRNEVSLLTAKSTKSEAPF